jgi:hypothetical protein
MRLSSRSQINIVISLYHVKGKTTLSYRLGSGPLSDVRRAAIRVDEFANSGLQFIKMVLRPLDLPVGLYQA